MGLWNGHNRTFEYRIGVLRTPSKVFFNTVLNSSGTHPTFEYPIGVFEHPVQPHWTFEYTNQIFRHTITLLPQVNTVCML